MSTAVMAVGVLLMIVTGIWVEQYSEGWLDPESGCAPRGACADPDMMRLGWWLEGLGLAVVVVGAAIRWLALAPSSQAATSGQARSAMLAGRSVVWASVLTALLAMLIGAATMVMLITFGPSSSHSVIAVVCMGGLLQAYAIAEIAATVRSTARSPRSAWVMAVVAGAIAGTVAALVSLDVVDVPSNSSLWIVGGWTVAVTVVVAVWWTVGAGRVAPAIP